MPSIVFLLLGAYLLVVSALFFAGKPTLVREKFRSRPDLKPYMRKCGAVYAVIGAAGVLLYFFQDAIFANTVLTLAFGVAVLAAVIALIVFNHLFVHKG